MANSDLEAQGSKTHDADDSETNDGEVKTEKNKLTSNSPVKKPVASKHIDVSKKEKRPTPSTSGPKGTEEPGSDKGPGGTGW